MECSAPAWSLGSPVERYPWLSGRKNSCWDLVHVMKHVIDANSCSFTRITFISTLSFLMKHIKQNQGQCHPCKVMQTNNKAIQVQAAINGSVTNPNHVFPWSISLQGSMHWHLSSFLSYISLQTLHNDSYFLFIDLLHLQRNHINHFWSWEDTSTQHFFSGHLATCCDIFAKKTSGGMFITRMIFSNHLVWAPREHAVKATGPQSVDMVIHQGPNLWILQVPQLTSPLDQDKFYSQLFSFICQEKRIKIITKLQSHQLLCLLPILLDVSLRDAALRFAKYIAHKHNMNNTCSPQGSTCTMNLAGQLPAKEPCSSSTQWALWPQADLQSTGQRVKTLPCPAHHPQQAYLCHKVQDLVLLEEEVAIMACLDLQHEQKMAQAPASPGHASSQGVAVPTVVDQPASSTFHSPASSLRFPPWAPGSVAAQLHTFGEVSKSSGGRRHWLQSGPNWLLSGSGAVWRCHLKGTCWHLQSLPSTSDCSSCHHPPHSDRSHTNRVAWAHASCTTSKGPGPPSSKDRSHWPWSLPTSRSQWALSRCSLVCAEVRLLRILPIIIVNLTYLQSSSLQQDQEIKQPWGSMPPNMNCKHKPWKT